MDEILDDEFHKKKKEKRYFEYGEVDNIIIARNWTKIIKGKGGKIKGECNEVLLDSKIELEEIDGTKLKIHLFKQLQSGAGSIMPRVAHTYKRLKIERELNFKIDSFKIRPKSILRSLLFSSKNNTKLLPNTKYHLSTKEGIESLKKVIAIKDIELAIKSETLELLEVESKNSTLVFEINIIPYQPDEINDLLKLIDKLIVAIATK